MFFARTAAAQPASDIAELDADDFMSGGFMAGLEDDAGAEEGSDAPGEGGGLLGDGATEDAKSGESLTHQVCALLLRAGHTQVVYLPA